MGHLTVAVGKEKVAGRGELSVVGGAAALSWLVDQPWPSAETASLPFGS